VIFARLSGAQTKSFRTKDSHIDQEIAKLEQKVERAKTLMVDGHIEPHEFQKIK
jgi:hypothetical protein